MVSEKNNRPLESSRHKRVLIENGRMLCPFCRSYLGQAVYGAKCEGIEVYCRNSRCKKHLRVELY